MHELQRELRGILLAQGDAALPNWLRAADGGVAQRLDVYRNTIAGTCTRALRLVFPAVERLVGGEFFEGAARVFARGEPPAAADLNAYGVGFPAFLEGFAPCAALGYLPDVARLDWAVAKALHAPDVPPLALDALSGLDEDEATSLRFAPHPSVSLLASEFPVDEIWRAVLAQDDAGMAAIELAGGPVRLVVKRLDGQAVVSRLSPVEWRFAAMLMAGRPFAELLATFGEGEVASLLAPHLMAGRLLALPDSSTGGTPP